MVGACDSCQPAEGFFLAMTERSNTSLWTSVDSDRACEIKLQVEYIANILS